MMRADLLVLLLGGAGLALLGCSSSNGGGKEGERLQRILEAMEKLRPLHTKLGKPGPHDWLAHHHEPGQSFAQYVRSEPTGPTRARHTVYVQPLGDFSKAQRQIVANAADFVGRYFDLEVKVRDEMPLSAIPDRARRVHPTWGVKQILTTYVLDEVLAPRLPDDAVAYIAFTTSDLWPGRGWNFVFGQASLSRRVGVWSIYRNGDPERGEGARRLCLLRTIKTATHELGHMLSMHHCTAYECNMCGSNHREEADRRPLACCPECVSKIWWITGANPIERYRRLADFCNEHGLQEQRDFYQKSIQALRAD
ncbi:MAG: archaemetzincin [bacterium]